MGTKTNFLSLGLVLLLAACGGGGGGGGSGSPNPPPPPPPPPPPVNAIPAGHWFGTLSNDTSAVIEEYVAMVDAGGRFRLVSVDSAVQMSGNFLVDVNAFTGDATAFADTGAVWLSGSPATTVTLEGGVVQGDAFSGIWTAASGERGSFAFVYDGTFYERAGTLDQLAGSWISYDDFGSPSVTFTILADGSFTGQNTLGCTSSGQFAVIDEGFNLFEVQSTIIGCAVAGEYIGLAFLADILGPNDALVFAVDNGSRATVLGFER
ncbi:MAG: hypothetical protein OEW35_02390 [Gammaproteobacteria bacterium]|nr:hypothetical protein [Gammaproteobacteria bacterium]MDH4254132.1 hypothetical protein [Gammaproteobacteria bacterium]MDH5309501.1 hypothetical protein [Gammaproteobacteria bacterium]